MIHVGWSENTPVQDFYEICYKFTANEFNTALRQYISGSLSLSCRIFYRCTAFRGRQTRRQPAQNDSILVVNKVQLLLPTRKWKHTNFNLVGVEFGRHVVAVELSSAWLVMVSDEPGLGTTDNCCTFTAKGRKKGRTNVRRGIYRFAKYRESLWFCSRGTLGLRNIGRRYTTIWTDYKNKNKILFPRLRKPIDESAIRGKCNVNMRYIKKSRIINKLYDLLYHTSKDYENIRPPIWHRMQHIWASRMGER